MCDVTHMNELRIRNSFKRGDEESSNYDAAIPPQSWLTYLMCAVTHVNESRMCDSFKRGDEEYSNYDAAIPLQW